MIFKRKDAGSNLIYDVFQAAPVPYSQVCVVCGYLGRNPREGVELARNSHTKHTTKYNYTKHNFLPLPTH
jgi:hypothetical protein